MKTVKKQQVRNVMSLPRGATRDELVFERIRVGYKRWSAEVREIEAYKLKYGYCIAHVNCLEKAVEGPHGGMRACAHHMAERKAGKRRRVWEVSPYGQRRKEQQEEEREQAKEAAARKERPSRKRLAS